MYRSFIKPFLDFLVAFIAFTLFLPIFCIITLLLFIANNGKPFFTQKRPGKDAKIFQIIKFKTMNDKKDENGKLLSDKERLTPIGSFVRKTSMDEIPQLLNVIKGEMSIIGPRPLLIEYLDLYNDFERKRHNVRPGITGWAQVNGRNTIDWTTKFKYDIEYVEKLSFKLDFKILLLTLKKVLKGSDITIVPVKRLVDEKKEINNQPKP